MTTDKQKAANQNNAQKATGPKTDEGKQRSSQNALRHGVYALQSVIAGEDPAEFDKLFIEFAERYHPDGPYERSLVRQMADAEWRLRRITFLETEFLDAAVEASREHHKQWRSKEPEPAAGRLRGRALQTRTRDLLHFARYGADLRRGQRQAYQALLEHRKEQNRALTPRDDHDHYAPAHRPGPREPFYHPAGDPSVQYNEFPEQNQFRPSRTESTTSDPPGTAHSDDPAA